MPSTAKAAPSACAGLQEKFPDWKGKTLVNAINPHTPGYEAIDPKDPNKYVGFDIDLGEEIGECLGFKVTYKAVTFAALLTTLASGQADIVISDIYATEERAKAADFITYSKVFDGVLVAKGNPKKIDGINLSLCGAAAAENHAVASRNGREHAKAAQLHRRQKHSHYQPADQAEAGHLQGDRDALDQVRQTEIVEEKQHYLTERMSGSLKLFTSRSHFLSKSI
jgi:ABC-type amino acid transport substrate-binding protein